MRQMFASLWSDDGGAIIAIEWILFVAIVLIGLIVGFVAIRNAVVDEITVIATAVDSVAVCYSYAGLSNCESAVCGSQVIDIVLPNTLNTHKTPATNIVVVVQNPCQ